MVDTLRNLSEPMEDCIILLNILGGEQEVRPPEHVLEVGQTTPLLPRHLQQLASEGAHVGHRGLL
jgi:hypothetical protein